MNDDLPIHINTLIIEPSTRSVTLDGQVVELTDPEYRLLAVLAGQPNRVFTREELLGVLWGSTHSISSRRIDALACRLRSKLRGPTRFVINLWGVGYRLLDPPNIAGGTP